MELTDKHMVNQVFIKGQVHKPEVGYLTLDSTRTANIEQVQQQHYFNN